MSVVIDLIVQLNCHVISHVIKMFLFGTYQLWACSNFSLAAVLSIIYDTFI